MPTETATNPFADLYLCVVGITELLRAGQVLHSKYGTTYYVITTDFDAAIDVARELSAADPTFVIVFDDETLTRLAMDVTAETVVPVYSTVRRLEVGSVRVHNKQSIRYLAGETRPRGMTLILADQLVQNDFFYDGTFNDDGAPQVFMAVEETAAHYRNGRLVYKLGEPIETAG